MAPQGIWLDKAGTLWVADTGNNRVLWWFNASSITSNGAKADGVLGQIDFISNVLNEMNSPIGVTVDGQTVWVADYGYNRVLRFDAPSTMGTPASGVVGQPNFTSPGSGCNGILSAPTYVVASSQGLYVSDTGNSRVLFYPKDQLGLTTGAQPSIVYGQLTISSCINPIIAPQSAAPYGLAITADGINLFVGDQNAKRVLLFAPAPASVDFSSAIDLFGESSFQSESTLVFHSPKQVAYDSVGNHLYVADSTSNQIIRFANVLVPVSNNDCSLGVQISFSGRTPSVNIFPRDANGKTQPGIFQVLVAPNSIDHLDGSGVVLRTVSLPTFNWNITTSTDASGNQIYVFSNLVSSSASVTIKYTLFAAAQTINSAGVTFSTQPGSLKFEVTLLGNWNFSQGVDSLRMHLQLALTPNATSPIQSGTSSGVTTFTLNGGTMTTVINLIGFGVADGVTNDRVNVSLTSISGDSYDLAIDFPQFNSEFIDDPDFSVTLVGGSGGGSGGSSDNLLPLLALISLVIPLAMCLIAVAVVIAVWLSGEKRDLTLKL